MGKVTASMSMSLDGFIAGPNVSVKNPLGEGGDRLHDCMLSGKTRSEAREFEEQLFEATGALIMGRRMFDVGVEPWGETHNRKRAHMRTVTSKDGTTIAFDRSGQGPALILVGGSLEHRALDAETSRLAAYPLMAQHFTLFHYDRRGRGDSTDTPPYAVQREIEDIEALINEASGSAFISGISSGAALAMEATIALPDKIKKLAMYEAPYNWPGFEDYRRRLNELVAAGRKGDALAAFMMFLGMPADQLDQVRQLSLWPIWESAALTLAYENAVLGEDAAVPIERAAKINVPALIMDGSESQATYPFIRDAADALAEAIPQAQRLTMEGQTHEVTPEALAPVLVEFFKA